MTIQRIKRTLTLEYLTDRAIEDLLPLAERELGCTSILDDKFEVTDSDVPQKIALAEAEAFLGLVTYAEALAEIEAKEGQQ